ncbi:hypothetical protein JB92DRAFT_2831401 [Gautieria morchelliformis]|nr:hypothetical protein JB92DRAFT_2831401 [Gautieria morchelliformis]
MNSLALELIEEIIGHVDKKDYISLCHLLASPWAPHEIQSEVQRLHEIHTEVHYIRVLELPDLWCYLPSTHSEAWCQGWTAIDKPLSSLLHKVTHVQELKISGLPWNVLSADFRMIALPGSRAALDGVHRPQADDNNQTFERRHISHLTRLDMTFKDNNYELINWLLGPRSHSDITHIHTLHISLCALQDDSVNQLLRAIGSSLKHVLITLPDVYLRVGPLNLRCPPGVDLATWEEVYRVLAGPHFQFLWVLYINIMPSGVPGNTHKDTGRSLLVGNVQAKHNVWNDGYRMAIKYRRSIHFISTGKGNVGVAVDVEGDVGLEGTTNRESLLPSAGWRYFGVAEHVPKRVIDRIAANYVHRPGHVGDTVVPFSILERPPGQP